MLRPPVVAEVRNSAVDVASEVLGQSAIGKTAKVDREHDFPIDRHLPRSRFVSEKDDPVRVLVDTTEQREEEFEWLASRFRRTLRHCPKTSSYEPIELGDKRVRPFDFCVLFFQFTSKLS
jgi:hypothetical protein